MTHDTSNTDSSKKVLRSALITLAFVGASCLVLPGCKLGNWAKSIDSDTFVPQLGFNTFPRQTEPKIE